jgi:hypothetical protein
MGFAQKRYHLDYALEFEITSLKGGEVKKHNKIYFVNSKKKWDYYDLS